MNYGDSVTFGMQIVVALSKSTGNSPSFNGVREFEFEFKMGENKRKWGIDVNKRMKE